VSVHKRIFLSSGVNGDLIEDPAKRWKVTRSAAVATAIACEAVHAVSELGRRREQAANLAACKEGRQAADTREEGQGRLVVARPDVAQTLFGGHFGHCPFGHARAV
jgi:hypothetical protein